MTETASIFDYLDGAREALRLEEQQKDDYLFSAINANHREATAPREEPKKGLLQRLFEIPG